MNPIVKQVLSSLAGQGVSRLAGRIGADESATESALSAVVPLLVSALAGNASRPEGAHSLQQALDRDHDGSILQNLGGFLENPEAANGAGILRHVLGTRQDSVTRGLARSTNLQQDQIGQLLQIAAPLVMGLLGKQTRSDGVDENSLPNFLGRQSRSARKADPGLAGMLTSLLDADRDGSALDDVIGALGRKIRGR